MFDNYIQCFKKGEKEDWEKKKALGKVLFLLNSGNLFASSSINWSSEVWKLIETFLKQWKRETSEMDGLKRSIDYVF